MAIGGFYELNYSLTAMRKAISFWWSLIVAALGRQRKYQKAKGTKGKNVGKGKKKLM